MVERTRRTRAVQGIVTSVSALVLAQAACMHDDGFRAKVARGCHSGNECARLAGEAHARYDGCRINDRSGDPHACDDQLGDLKLADQLLTAWNNAAARERQAQNRAKEEDLQRAERERDAATRAQAAQDQRGELRAELAQKFANAFRQTDMSDLEEVEDLSALRASLASSKSELEGVVSKLREVDSTAADQAQADIDAWVAKREKPITEEETCRATPKCIADRSERRIALDICRNIDVRKGAYADIAQERSNPSGVVDLNRLHGLGETIQEADSKLATLRKDYARVIHKSFNEAICPKLLAGD